MGKWVEWRGVGREEEWRGKGRSEETGAKGDKRRKLEEMEMVWVEEKEKNMQTNGYTFR